MAALLRRNPFIIRNNMQQLINHNILTEYD